MCVIKCNLDFGSESKAKTMKLGTILQNFKYIETNLSYVKIYRDQFEIFKNYRNQFANYKNYEGISHSHYFHKNYTSPIILLDDKIPFFLVEKGKSKKKNIFHLFG